MSLEYKVFHLKSYYALRMANTPKEQVHQSSVKFRKAV